MGMSDFYGPADETANLQVLNHALDIGVNFLDTADMYGVGANEEFLAPFLAAHRDEITLATKFGIEYRANDPSYRAIRNDPAFIKSAVEASLRRLKVEVIDLYYMHRRGPVIPLADSVGAMAELVREGKVKHLGLSEVTAPNCARRTPCTRSLPCRRSGRSSAGTSSTARWARRPSSGLPSCRIRRSAGAF
jgi:aryl-alcohol dehydrogenase-like predicted oxidoreductase